MHWSYLLRDPQSGTAPCGTASTRFEGLSCAALRSQSLGFTLIELMMVILVSAILAMIAIPSFQELLAKSRVNGSVNLLTTSFDLARSEALSKNRVTVLCRSGDPMAVAPTCIATGLGDFAADDWATGWIIYSKPAALTRVPDGLKAISAMLGLTIMVIRFAEPLFANGKMRRTS